MLATHRREERPAEVELLRDAVDRGDHGHDAERADAGVGEQLVDRVAQHRDLGDHDRPDQEDEEEESTQRQGLEHCAPTDVTVAGVGAAEVQRP